MVPGEAEEEPGGVDGTEADEESGGVVGDEDSELCAAEGDGDTGVEQALSAARATAKDAANA